MNAETTARPYRVGDRVRITDHNRHALHPDAQYVYEGVVAKIDPAADPESGEYDFGPYLWADTKPYTNPLSGEVYDRVFCPLTDDLTAGSGPEDLGRTIELLAAAPSDDDSSTPDWYEVRAAHKASADLAARWKAEDATPALVALDENEAALERVRALADQWDASDTRYEYDLPWAARQLRKALDGGAR